MRVLLVEDHYEVLEVVRRALETDDHFVTHAPSVMAAADLLSKLEIDAIVLDLALPNGDGGAWCRRIREGGFRMPVLVLAANSSVTNRVRALDAGADDFMAKPFAVSELRARVRALGRRGPLQRSTEHRRGAIHLDFSARRARVEDSEVPLTAREWNIIEFLTSRTGRVVSRDEITEKIWGAASDAAAASLDVLIGRIRKKLGTDFIRTVRREGYVAD